MNFPDFNDFLNTLTEDRLGELFGDIKQFEMIQLASLSPENLSAFITNLRHETLGLSVSLTLRVLGAYHEWLSTQLRQLRFRQQIFLHHAALVVPVRGRQFLWHRLQL